MKKDAIYIAVAGGTASGKTTFAEMLGKNLEDHGASVIGLDSYYRDRSHIKPALRADFNYDHPDAFDTDLLRQHLNLLASGGVIHVPVYSYVTHSRIPVGGRSLSAPGVVIMEGILALHWPEIRDFFDYKIFIETPSELRLERRIERDIKERGRTRDSVIEQWNDSVEEMYMTYCEPSRVFADEVISGVYFDDSTFASLVKKVRDCFIGRA